MFTQRSALLTALTSLFVERGHRRGTVWKICTLHHVMIRRIEGKGIFWDTQGREDPVTRLEDLSEQTSTRILA